MACGNDLILIGSVCKFCRTRPNELPPKVNQVSGDPDEKVFRCPSCRSYHVFYCSMESSLRCRKCSRLISYDEATAW